MDTFCMVFVSRRDDNSGRLPGRDRVGGGVEVGVAAGWERAADELAVAADKERQMNWRLQPIESLGAGNLIGSTERRRLPGPA
jgi:hypothetical protein